MLAVSVDGNRKLYRFHRKTEALMILVFFEGLFVAEDSVVSTFVDTIQKAVRNTQGRGTCGDSQWTAARETSRKASKLDEEWMEVAVSHATKCEIKWSGRNQEGAGTTAGEEVKQVNSYLSHCALTTKYMSKAARVDMVTLHAVG
ncbi:uncharacterized protein LOC125139385 [Tachysurus ichikawai]